MNLTYEQAMQVRDQLESELKIASDVLQRFPKGAMGLTPDEVKFSPEFKLASKNYDNAFRTLRKFNTIYVRQFRKEINAARAARYATKGE